MNRQNERTEGLLDGEQQGGAQRCCISAGAYCCLITSAILLVSTATVDVVDSALALKNIDPGLKLGMNVAMGAIAGLIGVIGVAKVVSEKRQAIGGCISRLFGCNNGASIDANAQARRDDGLDVEAGSVSSESPESKL